MIQGIPMRFSLKGRQLQQATKGCWVLSRRKPCMSNDAKELQTARPRAVRKKGVS